MCDTAADSVCYDFDVFRRSAQISHYFQFCIVRYPSELFKYCVLCLCLFRMCPIHCPLFHSSQCAVLLLLLTTLLLTQHTNAQELKGIELS
jgi:hypothetical protein